MTTEPEAEVNVPVHVGEDEHYDALAETEDDRSRVEEAHTERIFCRISGIQIPPEVLGA